MIGNTAGEHTRPPISCKNDRGVQRSGIYRDVESQRERPPTMPTRHNAGVERPGRQQQEQLSSPDSGDSTVVTARSMDGVCQGEGTHYYSRAKRETTVPVRARRRPSGALECATNPPLSLLPVFLRSPQNQKWGARN